MRKEGKRCPQCKEIKSFDLFYKTNKTKTGCYSWCKSCCCLGTKRFRKENVEKSYLTRRNNKLKRRYLISSEEYEKMYSLQNGRCRICYEFSLKLNIDHNHTTNKIRGLLCRSCNWGIGSLQDSIALLESATTYLKSFEEEINAPF
jgi:hypothetical protein